MRRPGDRVVVAGLSALLNIVTAETARIWDIATGAVVQELRSPRPDDGLDITGVTG